MNLFHVNKSFYVRFFILVSILLTIIFFGYIGFKHFSIDGESMSPSYESRDRVVANKMTYKFSEPQRNDVIIFYDVIFDDFLIKRIIGIRGDIIEIVDGDIYLNGEKIEDEYSYEKIVDEDLMPANEGPFYIYEDFFWVIGDNRDISWYGFIHIEEIIGKVE